MHIGTSWANKINVYTIITTNCANNCKVLVPPIPTIKQKQSMWLLAVKLKQSYFSSLRLLLIHYLAFVSALGWKLDFCKSEGKGDGRRLMTEIHECSECRHAVPPSRLSQQNIRKASKPKGLRFQNYVFWLYPSLLFLKDKKKRNKQNITCKSR